MMIMIMTMTDLMQRRGEAALKVKKRCKIKTCFCEVNF